MVKFTDCFSVFSTQCRLPRNRFLGLALIVTMGLSNTTLLRIDIA